MSTVLPLTVDQGSDITYTLRVLGPTGSPLNLAAYTITALIKPSSSSPDGSALATFTQSSGISVVAAASGEVRFTVPHADTASAGVFWWRLDLHSAGLVYTAIKGAFTVSAS